MKDKEILFLIFFALCMAVFYITVAFFVYWLVVNFNKTVVAEDNYTVSEMCPNGKQAKQEISADGKKIINFNCDNI